MARGRTESLLVRKVTDDGSSRAPDQVIVEEPMEIRLDGTRVTTTMRTPGHDYELAVGFCVAEGLLAGAPVRAVRYCAVGSAADTAFNVVTVETGGAAPVPEPRLSTTTSSCGWCGTDEIQSVVDRLAPLAGVATFDPDLLATFPEVVGPHQELFALTGGVHAAAAIDGDADGFAGERAGDEQRLRSGAAGTRCLAELAAAGGGEHGRRTGRRGPCAGTGAGPLSARASGGYGRGQD